MATFTVGQVVKVGRGDKLWRIEKLWEHNGGSLASLQPLTGYTGTTVELARLVRTCRECGCTDAAACQPFPCWWVAPDLCSGCGPQSRPADLTVQDALLLRGRS